MASTDVKSVFDNADKNFNANAAKGMDAVFQFNITGDGGGSWNVTIKDGTCKVLKGTHDSPTVTLAMSGETWLAIVNKKLNGMQAFMNGQLKVSGNIMHALKIEQLFSM